MTISCFGASVTAQKNGYPVYLEKKFNQKVNAYGYGSEHLVYSGMIHIDKVLQSQPSICFIDWFTTGWLSKCEKTITALNTIKYKFSINNCKLIFLFLPRKDHSIRIDFYNFVKEYLHFNNLSFIDLNDHLTYSEEIIRDEVHTTEYGSEKYAEIICNEYNKIGAVKCPINIDKNKYCDFKELSINQIFKKKLQLKGNGEIILDLNIGPNSGYIKCNEKEVLLWDIYCHYKRTCSHHHFYVKDNCEITILDKKVDYSLCKRDFNFDDVEFELDVIKIYYTGDHLEFNGD